MSEAPSLRKLFGDTIDLSGEGESSAMYRILAELDVNGGRYAILQTEAMKQEGDVEVMRVVIGPDGDPELETVEDDEEWEQVAEAYDDALFGSDERP